jgi:hypothetical protein
MADRPLGKDFTTGQEVIIAPLTEPSGGNDGGRVIAIKPDGSNKIDPGFVPDASIPTRTYTAAETIGARTLCYVDESGGAKAGLAVANSANKGCAAYSESGAASGAPVTVQFYGDVIFDIGTTGVTAGDLWHEVFLGTTAGIPMKAPGAISTGQYNQSIGMISSVDTGNSTFHVILNIQPHRLVK